MEGASSLVRTFDSKGRFTFMDQKLTIEHPFSIIKSRGHSPKTYLVVYGLSTIAIPPSPLFQKVWHTAAQMKARMNIALATVDSAVSKFSHSARSSIMSLQPAKLLKREC